MLERPSSRERTLKLFYSPGACSLAPHIVLDEIGKPYEVQLVNTMDGSTRSSEYLKITPKGRVPLLSTKGETITEVSAIMTYLALSNPESNLISTARRSHPVAFLVQSYLQRETAA